MTVVANVPAATRAPPRWFSAISRRRGLATLLFLAVFPWLAPYEALAVNILIFGLYALGFNLLFGYAGLLSFGHGALLGAGAYGCGIAIVHYGVGWFGAILIGVALATAVAAVMGFLAIRTRGIYFAMVTLALSMCVYYIFYQAQSLTGGENGLRGVNLQTIGLFGFAIPFINPTVKYYVVLVFVGLAILAFSRILSSPFGAVLEAIRENEARARACGYDVALTKLIAFILSGAFCGLAGALSALHLTTVSIETMHYVTSGQVVLMTLLGGMGSFFGPFVGAAAFLLIEDVVSVWTRHWQLFVGLTFMIFVLFLPRGVWGETVAFFERRGS